MHMDTQKTLLEKVDLFQVIFIIHLTGLLIQPKLDLVIPLYHPFLNAVLMKIVLTAWGAYLAGKYLMRIMEACRNKSETDSDEINIKVLLFLIVLQFAVVMIRYFARGIPLFSSTPDIAKGAFLAPPTYGCTRILYIGLPLSLFIYMAYQFKNEKEKKLITPRNVFFLTIGLLPLFIGLFKGSVITFLLGMVLVYDKFKKRIRIRLSFRNLLLAVLVVLMPIFQYYFSEGERNFHLSASYVFQRLLVYSQEGFNYIVYAELPPNWMDQLRTFLGLAVERPGNPGFLLSQDMLNREEPTFSTVTTLYGFCWRNGGWLTLIIGFAILGAWAEILIRRIRFSNSVFWVSFHICLFIVLLKTVLVGEPFNDLRGPILSLLCAVAVFEITKKEVVPHENPVS